MHPLVDFIQQNGTALMVLTAALSALMIWRREP